MLPGHRRRRGLPAPARAAETKRVPIVFLTARTGEQARISGLALGADDYVVKPFSMPELLLRIRAILRRATPVEVRLPPLWVRMRDQFRIWSGYAEIHFERARVARVSGGVAEHPAELRGRVVRGRSANAAVRAARPTCSQSSAVVRQPSSEQRSIDSNVRRSRSHNDTSSMSSAPRNRPRPQTIGRCHWRCAHMLRSAVPTESVLAQRTRCTATMTRRDRNRAQVVDVARRPAPGCRDRMTTPSGR